MHGLSTKLELHLYVNVAYRDACNHVCPLQIVAQVEVNFGGVRDVM